MYMDIQLIANFKGVEIYKVNTYHFEFYEVDGEPYDTLEQAISAAKIIYYGEL